MDAEDPISSARFAERRMPSVMLQQGNGVLPSHRSEDQPPNRRHPEENPQNHPLVWEKKQNAKPFKWRKREVKGSQLRNTIVNLCN
jgi:hypothetical protein